MGEQKKNENDQFNVKDYLSNIDDLPLELQKEIKDFLKNVSDRIKSAGQ